MSDASLDLGTVRKRFVESADTLQQLQERLRALALAEETSMSAATALDATARANEATAAQLGELAQQVRQATQSLASALTIAEDFLRQTDLSVVNATLAKLSSDLSASTEAAGRRLNDQIAGLQGDLGGKLDTLAVAVDRATQAAEERASAAESRAAAAEQTAAAASSELLAVKAKIPERTRRKLGIA